jgi:hypothetical protein
VLKLCDTALATESIKPEDAFWAAATKVEALVGLGRAAEAEALRDEISGRSPANAAAPTPRRAAGAQWMIDSMDEQLAKLVSLNP